MGTSSGVVAIYNWDWFGDSKDRVIGHPEGVECMVNLNDNVLITGGEDGWIRVVGLYPHSVNLFKKHAETEEDVYAICSMDMSHDERILATISHDCAICFYDLTEIADQVEEADAGEKIQLETDKELGGLKNEMNNKSKNKEKQEERIHEKKKKLDFFKDM